ncbi:MAG: choice-of-anchor tandem repeat GloVer-containing protein [Candidatus Sulfotelmatobacter sp.]|jgi:uncharacterized repeat protein (TIGR03803 family)
MHRPLHVFLLFVSKRSLAITITLVVLVASAVAGSNEQVIYRFQGGSDGYNPSGDLLADKAGNFYGTTVEGGTGGSCGYDQNGCGTVFEVSPPAQPGDPWVETVLYRFTGDSDGYWPTAALVADKNGNLYSTTYGGGTRDHGTIFELKRPSSPGAPWIHRVLYNFQGVPSGSGDGDGSEPGGMVFDAAGNLYGTTNGGGFCTEFEGLSNCYGSVFELAAPSTAGGAWTESVAYRFSTSGNSFSNPHGGVIFDKNGNLYGTTYVGGAFAGGVFELMPPSAPGSAWTETTLDNFNSIDGGGPNGSLVFDGAGNLYGTTLIGGAANAGTVFELSPPASPGGAWTETVLYSFQSSGDGNSPLANVIFDRSGNLFSTDWMGGEFNRGTVFQLTPPSNGGEWTETTLHNFGSGNDGQEPNGGVIWGRDGALYGTTTQGGSAVSEQCKLDGYAWSCGVVFRIEP